MTDEEKKAIEIVKGLAVYYDDYGLLDEEEIEENEEVNNSINIVVNLIEKQSKEIEHQKEKRENQKKELAILNAKQVEFNKLVNTVNSYKGQFKRQQKEIEELKEDNKHQWEERCKLTFELENSTSNDKIKAKIEETNNEELNYTEDEYWLEQEIKGYAIDKMQSLLEKE